MSHATWKVEGQGLIKAEWLGEGREGGEGLKDNSRFLTWTAQWCHFLERGHWRVSEFECGHNELNLEWVDFVLPMGHLQVDQQGLDIQGWSWKGELGLRKGFSKLGEWDWSIFIGLGEGISDGAQSSVVEWVGIATHGRKMLGDDG